MRPVHTQHDQFGIFEASHVHEAGEHYLKDDHPWRSPQRFVWEPPYDADISEMEDPNYQGKHRGFSSGDHTGHVHDDDFVPHGPMLRELPAWEHEEMMHDHPGHDFDKDGLYGEEMYHCATRTGRRVHKDTMNH